MENRERRAREIMLAFVERTGLTTDRPPERYLWTDAFAVCNFLGLGEIDLAERLINQVHRVLGTHRPDNERTGWISGLPSQEAERHPTIGGLRIGKKQRERAAGEPLDDRLEWDRDGQYFHYLTRWIHALDRVARVTGNATFSGWARELAATAHRAFTVVEPIGRHGRRMYWKMSIDLSRPQVPSMGHHDPLDGYATCLELEATSRALGQSTNGPSLVDAAADFRAMIPSNLTTTDPLGLGGLLTDAWRLVQVETEAPGFGDDSLLDRLVDAAANGIAEYMASGELRIPAVYRLAFRELGLAIGLHAAEQMSAAKLKPFTSLGPDITDFWLTPVNQRAATWVEHLNINEVMLATSLAPEGYLGEATPNH
jgi:hypothetical protein